MSGADEIKRFGRGLGIVAVFTALGPIVVAAALLAIGLVIGVPAVLILLLVFDFQTLSQFTPLILFGVMLVMLWAPLPAFIGGIVSAVAAVYFGANSLRVALLGGVLGALVLVFIGYLMTKPWDLFLWVPHVEKPFQALAAVVLTVLPAAMAAAMCWLATRKLHSVQP